MVEPSKLFRAVAAAGLLPLLLAMAAPRPPYALLTSSSSRRQDSYAIYSLLLPAQLWQNMDSSRTKRWAIARNTINAADIDPALAPEAALQAPPDHPQWFEDAVGDYNMHKNLRQRLSRDLQVDRPYVLLSRSEVAELRSVLTSMNASSALIEKYNGIPGITYFSEVYFNPEQTGALVYMLNWCGNLCSQAGWIYLEKQNGQWVRWSGNGSS